MKVKSADYIVNHAVSLAASEENANILVAYSNRCLAYQDFERFSEIAIPLGFSVERIHKRFVKGNTKIVFAETPFVCDAIQYFGATNFSHIFIIPGVRWDVMEYLQSRIRETNNSFKEKSGMYTEVGKVKTVWSNY